jgi:hypothetical protein
MHEQSHPFGSVIGSLTFCGRNYKLEVLNLLSNVDISKACGSDNISNRIIKLCAIGIHKPFTRLLNTSYRLGQYPNAWKFATVIPLFKKDNRQNVLIRLYNFLENCGLFNAFSLVFVLVILQLCS